MTGGCATTSTVAPVQESIGRDGVLHQLRDIDGAWTQIAPSHGPPEDPLGVGGELFELAEREPEQLVVP